MKGLGLLFCAPLLIACVSADGFKLQDSGTFMPTVRAAGDVWGEREINPREEPRGEFEDMEAGLTGTAGSDSGFDYDIFELWLGGRYGIEKPRWTLAGIGAVAYNHFDFKGNGISKESSDKIGPMLGGQFDLRFAKRFTWYIRGTYLWLPGDDEAASVQAETGIAFTLRDDVDFFLGWRYWRYEQEDLLEGPVSDVEIETNGIVAGFQFRF